MRTQSNSRVTAVILAAGKSSRMGTAKQLLPLSSGTVLEQTLANVRTSGLDEIVLVLGASADSIRGQLSDPVIEGVKVVINENYEEGMASSLRAGISALNPHADAALIILADQPFIRSETFARIVDVYRRTRAQIVIPMHQGFRGNPVLLDQSVFSEVMGLEGDIGCRAIFGNHLDGIVKVEVGDPGILLDIDNKDDYERLRHFAMSGETANAPKQQPAPKSAPETEARGELILIGWEPVTMALAKLGHLLNFTVRVMDPLVTSSDVPPGVTALNALDFSLLPEAEDRHVVVASRGRFDEEAVEQALWAECRYVGLVANRKRGQELLRRLEHSGMQSEKLASLRMPAGLDIGAKTPEEIALSILAEIVAQREGKFRG